MFTTIAALCTTHCGENGICVAPDLCECYGGWAGNDCQTGNSHSDLTIEKEENSNILVNI